MLAWLNSHPSRWKTFIANRTSEILEFMTASQWHYIRSKSNPADIASRGILPQDLINNSLWWNGPIHDDLNFGSKVFKLTNEEMFSINIEKRNERCFLTKSETNHIITK